MLLASYISWVDVESVWENGLSRKSERAPGSHGRLLKALPIVIHEKMLFMPISCVKSAACLVIFCCAQCQYDINCVFKILKLVSIMNCKTINVFSFCITIGAITCWNYLPKRTLNHFQFYNKYLL